MKAVYMGLGYIGLPSAALTASYGIEVVGVDTNPDVVNIVNQGKAHFFEPDLDRMVKAVVSKGQLRAASIPEEAAAFFIVVPTPFKENHLADTSYVESAIRMIIPCLREGNLVVIESTVPVLTTERMAAVIFGERPELQGKIFIAYCPERVLPGNILYELEHNDRVIGGLDPESADRGADFFARFVRGALHKTNARTAEICKLAENASRDVMIAFVNELSLICDRIGVNAWDLIDLANKHPRVNLLQPGCGVGGHCIAVDPWFLVADFPAETRLIKQARLTNDYKTDWCTDKVLNLCSQVFKKTGKKPVVACMGLTFKPDIDDLRESPAIFITKRIIAESDAEVLISEPNIENHPVFRLTPYEEAYKKADIVVWLVRHKAFLRMPSDTGKTEIDFCGVRRY
ncbi:MAG: UDP-N-acetyl-D-mannosamine dehydrogenase [Treponema sp.]|jgi:UDP-N-acetyl-D-mannosaminuronic acid dehydrogenase|nr:UDP-N-acetyl-D-mannosamine dehydrogenase [Treponema sp.]